MLIHVSPFQARYGFGFVEGVPGTVKDTENLAKRLSFIRVTHFGGFWDFLPNLEHADTAYTTLALGAHTDNTYFTDPAGYTVFFSCVDIISSLIPAYSFLLIAFVALSFSMKASDVPHFGTPGSWG